MALISSNAFARSAYAERLRQHLSTAARFEQFIDLGDIQVFEDAKDVYPAIVVASKPSEGQPTDLHSVRTIRLRRQHEPARLSELVESSGWNVPIERLASGSWGFEEPGIVALRAKLRNAGQLLGAYLSRKPYLGLKSGLNGAFVVDSTRRAELIASDPASEQVLKPFVRGQESGGGMSKIRESG